MPNLDLDADNNSKPNSSFSIQNRLPISSTEDSSNTPTTSKPAPHFQSFFHSVSTGRKSYKTLKENLRLYGLPISKLRSSTVRLEIILMPFANEHVHLLLCV